MRRDLSRGQFFFGLLALAAAILVIALMFPHGGAR